MNAARLLVLAAVLSVALVAIPGEVSVAGTASANVCHPHLVEGDLKGYMRCTEQQCQWRDGRLVCTD